MPTLTGMKDGGFYDANSGPQRAGMEALIEWVEGAAAALPIDAHGLVSFADLGCSEGGNSISLCATLLAALGKRSPGVRVRAFFSDLASNNFNGLFGQLAARGLVTRDRPDFFPAAVPGSFYGPLFPPGSLQLVTSFNALQWLDQLPAARIPELIYFPGMTGNRAGIRAEPAVAHALAAQANRELTEFYRRRADELVPGGQLLVGACGHDDRYHTAHGCWDLLGDALFSLAHEGQIEPAVPRDMLFPLYFRSLDDLVAPLARPDSTLAGCFTIDKAEARLVPIAFEDRFDRSGDAAAYADEYVAFLQAFSEPLLRQFLLAGNVSAEVVPLAYERARELCRAHPDRYRCHFVEVALLATRN